MPRPPSDLQTYAVQLTPADAALAEEIAADLGILSDRGLPSRSGVIRHLIREEGKRLERRRKKSGKSEG